MDKQLLDLKIVDSPLLLVILLGLSMMFFVGA